MKLRLNRYIMYLKTTERREDNVGLTLRALRANNHLTQKEAAAKIGISEDTWANWENAKTFPDVPKIKKIEEVFNISYNEIIFLPNITVKP